MKRITQPELQNLYGPMPADFTGRIDSLLASLPAREENRFVKRKMTLAIILTLALLLSIGTAAALLNWNAIWALYGQEKPELEQLLVPVNQRTEAGGVSMEVTSALTDGRTLVLDWRFTTPEDNLPVHIQAEKLLINGQEQPITRNGLQVLWLQKGETLHQSCEIFPLAPAMTPGDTIRVGLTLRVARPRQEVIVLPRPEDAERAAQLRTQGTWAVAPQCLVFSYRFDEDNVLSEFDANDPTSGLLPAWNTLEADGFPTDLFDCDKLQLSFDVTVPETKEQPLFPDRTHVSMAGCTLDIVEAFRTPLGVYTTVELISDAPASEDMMTALRQVNAYETQLRLGQDKPPVDFFHVQELPVWQDAEGRLHRLCQANMIGYQEGLAHDERVLTLSIGESVVVLGADGTPDHGYYANLHDIPLHMTPPVQTE